MQRNCSLQHLHVSPGATQVTADSSFTFQPRLLNTKYAVMVVLRAGETGSTALLADHLDSGELAVLSSARSGGTAEDGGDGRGREGRADGRTETPAGGRAGPRGSDRQIVTQHLTVPLRGTEGEV
ncbi:unnamed protein product [Boreogadus saida]